MERKLAIAWLLIVVLGCGVGVSVVFAQSNSSTTPMGVPAAKASGWYDVADVLLRVCTLFVLSGGLIGTFAVLVSLRAAAYSQIYGRFQGVLLKMADRPDLFDKMKREEYTAAENDANNLDDATKPHRFLANCIVNLYEEAFLLHESKVLSVIDTVPEDYWQSMLGSMRAAFQLKYVRTHWEQRQSAFSSRFNQFVRDDVLTDRA